jgi:hypothetical protein
VASSADAATSKARSVVHDEHSVDREMRARFLAIARAQHIATQPVPGRPDIPLGAVRRKAVAASGGAVGGSANDSVIGRANEKQLVQLQQAVDADEAAAAAAKTQSNAPTKGSMSADQIRRLLATEDAGGRGKRGNDGDDDDMVSYAGGDEEHVSPSNKRNGVSADVDDADTDVVDEARVPSDDMAAHLRSVHKASVQSRQRGAAAASERTGFQSAAARAVVARVMGDFDRVMLSRATAASAASAAAVATESSQDGASADAARVAADALAHAHSESAAAATKTTASKR